MRLLGLEIHTYKTERDIMTLLEDLELLERFNKNLLETNRKLREDKYKILRELDIISYKLGSIHTKEETICPEYYKAELKLAQLREKANSLGE